jgi:hypothetical protein
MSTYNGWTVVTFPTSPAAPAGLEVQYNSIVATSTNPFTGQQTVQVWTNGASPAGYYELSISMPSMSKTDGQTWATFLQSLDGPACVFQLPSGFASTFPVELETSGSSRYWRLKGNSQKWSIKEGQIYGITFEVREAI